MSETAEPLAFVPFRKIPRLSRPMVITEKIDGTNACIIIGKEGEFITCSRNRIITPEDDNYGFSRWANENKEELLELGPGRHFGEWWGQGIQRGYGLSEKRFSLFNTARWEDVKPPSCCGVVPVLTEVLEFNTGLAGAWVESLRLFGSTAAPGFMRPEGIVVLHTASGQLFKKTLEDDEKGKPDNV